jgi:glycosyltransferase involved in cell wall biosynthesis
MEWVKPPQGKSAVVSVLHGSAWYPPAHLGGTEIYLTGLVRELRSAQGIESRIVAPLAPDIADAQQFEGTTIRTYEVKREPSRREFRRDDADSNGVARFREILEEEAPNIYHQHSWTRGLGIQHLRAARTAGVRTVLTIHVPGNICLRGTMMRFGEAPCTVAIDRRHCSTCWADARGASRPVARALSVVPPIVGNTSYHAGLATRWGTALAATYLAERQRREFDNMIDCADRVVAVSGWLYASLVLNGVAIDKLVLSRQGVDGRFADEVATRKQASPQEGVFRLLYLGRWDKTKGIDIVVEAMRRIPRDIAVELDIHAIAGGGAEQAYAEAVRAIIADDPRIRICEPVTRDRLVHVLSKASALVVPSVWMETGPLVVLEAKACGVPVIGSRLGGIAELVSEPEDGELVAMGDVASWAEAIVRMAKRGTTNSKRNNRPVRTMRDAATDMAAVYRSLL